jgi:multicomponent Na+:H+ antiporter subunit D
MGAAIALLLAAGLAIGVMPGAHSVANRAAATFIDSAGYAHQALYGSSKMISAPNASNWTGLGLVLGFVSALLACLIAGAALYGRRVVDRILPSLRSVYRPIEFLQKLHSGHVGDYVAWMMMGMTIVAGFVGLPVR